MPSATTPDTLELSLDDAEDASLASDCSACSGLARGLRVLL